MQLSTSLRNLQADSRRGVQKEWVLSLPTTKGIPFWMCVFPFSITSDNDIQAQPKGEIDNKTVIGDTWKIVLVSSYRVLQVLSGDQSLQQLRVQMSTATKRLMKDLKRLQDEKDDDIVASPEETNFMKWTATIVGPQNTIWEDGLFSLKMTFPEEYPNKPPEIFFSNKMFHPNIYANGSICLDLLKKDWNPSFDIYAILNSIRILLGEPNPNSPANHIAAELYQNNEKEYIRRVKQVVEESMEEEEEQE